MKHLKEYLATGHVSKCQAEITVTQLLVTLFFVGVLALVYYAMLQPAVTTLGEKLVTCVTTQNCSW